MTLDYEYLLKRVNFSCFSDRLESVTCLIVTFCMDLNSIVGLIEAAGFLFPIVFRYRVEQSNKA